MGKQCHGDGPCAFCGSASKAQSGKQKFLGIDVSKHVPEWVCRPHMSEVYIVPRVKLTCCYMYFYIYTPVARKAARSKLTNLIGGPSPELMQAWTFSAARFAKLAMMVFFFPSYLLVLFCCAQLLGDWVRDFASAVGVVLGHGRRVVVYSGREDFICNYFGGAAWTNATQWSGAVSHVI